MTITILLGDVRERLADLPNAAFDCVVTSPPYWGLRDYGVDGQIGLEPTLDDYLDTMADVFAKLWLVLKDDGTCWLNIGDSYAGSWGAQSRGSNTPGSLSGASMLAARQIRVHPKPLSGAGSIKRTPGLKPKDLMMIPARLALRLQEAGWYVRSEIIWHKLNPMPESVKDRPTSANEKIFLLTKSDRYWFNADAVREPAYDTGRINGIDGREEKPCAMPPGTSPRKLARIDYSERGRNLRNVWSIASQPFKEAHFATFPPALAETCIKAGCRPGGHVLDPFFGAGTTGLVADRLGRNCTGIELNPKYIEIAQRRIEDDCALFAEVAAE